MTTKQNANVPMADEQLDEVFGGLIAIIAIVAYRPVNAFKQQIEGTDSKTVVVS